MKDLTAVVLTKDEEKNIKECIQALDFCDEIIVVDDNSKDKTRKIAKKLGAKVYERDLRGNFAQQRNFALEKAKNKWVLFIDPDERVTDKLADEIRKELSGNEVGCNGYYLKRKDFLFGKKLKHGEVGNVRLLRLARRGAGEWQREVHEKWVIFGKTKTLKNPLLHYPHQSLFEYVSSVKQYSGLHAKANKKEGKKSSLIKVVFWPLFKFIKNYFIKFGFLDRTAGFVHAILMSFHSFVSWSELWLMQKENPTKN